MFLNIGYFYRRYITSISGRKEPEFYTFPIDFIKKHHDKTTSWEKVMTRGLDIEKYKNDAGFELIAVDLGIDYPSRNNSNGP